ncbi:uncharacterized protein LOC101451424 [Ceratitis capitata]|uniref:(Mediterranean fruit fly) hypothetical protein n=2 Tax=Ceratitis capitata TaxID=7213 RepID=A0A811UDB6_CERCA|nr:uncharacterized protein LOC101451424 [Ceratitis capitata]CAD6996318.1 unnamed protein product [Ceratitis capitata]
MSENLNEFNSDELQAPEWLNDDFFLKVLTNCENKTSKIILNNAKISPASMKGDHYASVMFRALLDYDLDGVAQTKSVIVKTIPETEGHKKEMLDKSNIFETEINMYNEALPRFEQILRDCGDNTVLKPSCLYSALEPKQVIVLEDLVASGYEVVRDRVLSEEEVKATYAKLAKWHAVSYKIGLEEPHYFDKIKGGIFTLSFSMDMPFLTDGIKYFVDMLKATPSLQEYLPYFEAIKPNLWEKCRASFAEYREAPQENGCYVLCHGDFHTKNAMFKYQNVSRELEDVMLLDFQVSYFGPLANDLIYSLYLLLDENLRLEFNTMLYYYYTVFKSTLIKIGFTGSLPTLEQIRQQYYRQRYFELFIVVTFLPIRFAFTDQGDRCENALTSDDFRRNMYYTKGYLKYLEEILPRYLHLGYFEDLV